MDVLHTMYPEMTDMPEPTSILFHRWYNDPLTRGSYSNWPASFFQEHHANLRATVDERVWFTGEHCSQKYFVRVSFFCSRTLVNRTAFRASCTVRGSKGETLVKNSRCVSRVVGVQIPGSTLRM